MITDEALDRYRLEGTRIRVVRDDKPENDVRGYIVAWDDQYVLLRRWNRNVVKLDRSYSYQLYEKPRQSL